MRIIVRVGAGVFVLDQLTKYYVVHMLNLDRVLAIDVVPPYLNLRMAWNHGINFGLLAADHPMVRWVLIAVALGVCGVVLWWVKRQGGGGRQDIAAGLLIGGALGNAVDRLIYGAVADFLNMSCCGLGNPYSFNVADMAVFAGAVGMMVFAESNKTA